MKTKNCVKLLSLALLLFMFNACGTKETPGGEVTPKNYTITFDKNDDDAVGTMGSQEIAEGSSANLTANSFTKPGWGFAGWAESSTGAVVYDDQANYAMGSADVTLYAKWTAIDASFNVTTGVNDRISTMAILSNGKILIGGGFTLFGETTRNRIARLNVDGTLDSSFDPGTGANNYIHSITLQSDGKILIVGNFTTYNGTSRNRIARLNSDGTLDTSFDPGTGADWGVYSLAIQNDGKILIVGDFEEFNGINIRRIVRLNSNGTQDTSFNPGIGASNALFSVAIQSDGKILIGGEIGYYNGTSKYGIARINADGTLDSSFGYYIHTAVKSIVIQSDNKIIIGGRFSTSNGDPFNRIARFNTDGTLDTSFNPGAGANNYIETVTLQSNGKILIGGDFTSFDGAVRNHIARLNSDGTLDTSFASGSGASSTIYSIALQDDGKILIGGAGMFTSYNGTPVNRIARLFP